MKVRYKYIVVEMRANEEEDDNMMTSKRNLLITQKRDDDFNYTLIQNALIKLEKYN